MRCSIFLLAALAVKASADVAAVSSAPTKVFLKKKATTEESNAPAQAAAAPAAAPRQAGVTFGVPPAVDPLSGTTAAPWKRIVPPVVAAAALAAGVGGLIALSVNKLPTTTLSPAALAKAKEAAVKAKEVASTVAPVTTTVNGTATDDIVSSGMTQNTLLAVACGLVVCGMLAICIVCIMQLCCNKKKRTRKLPPARETPMPEDQMPMMASQMESARGPSPDLNESQYMPVSVPPLVAGSGYAGGVGLGSIPTMANVVPMQTMPPPPPQQSYAAAGTSVYQSAAPAAPVGSYSMQRSYIQQGSQFQQASPLANTVSALPTVNNMPTTAFNMQAPPTTYFN